MEKKRKILPMVYLFICLALLWVLQIYAPVQQLIEPPLAFAGIVLVFFGIYMAAVSANRFVKAETGLIPFDEASTLVTGGFYRFTRNPMYLGMLLMLSGVAFMLGNVSGLLPLILFVLVIQLNFIAGEERMLEAAFGQQYLDYKSSVRRWI